MCELLADLALCDECEALDLLAGRRWFGSPSRSEPLSFSSFSSFSPDPVPPAVAVILNPVSGSIVSSGRDASSLRDVSERFGGLGLSAALYASRIHWISASRVEAAFNNRGDSTVTCSQGLHGLPSVGSFRSFPSLLDGGCLPPSRDSALASSSRYAGESTLRTRRTDRVSSTSAGSVAVSRLRRANRDSRPNPPAARGPLELEPGEFEPSPPGESEPPPPNAAPPALLPSSISITALYPSASWSKSPVPKPRQTASPGVVPPGESTLPDSAPPRDPLPVVPPPLGLSTSPSFPEGGSSTRTSSSSTSSVSSRQLGS